MRFDEEPPTAILGAAVRDLEHRNIEVTEDSLFAATKRKGIDRGQVKDFLEKAKRGQKRGHYPGYQEKPW